MYYTVLDLVLDCDTPCDCSPFPEGAEAPGEQVLLDSLSWFINQHLPVLPDTPAPPLTVNFRGGNPLQQWDILTNLLASIRALRPTTGLDIRTKLRSRLTTATVEQLKYLFEQGVRVGVVTEGTGHRFPPVAQNAHYLLSTQPDAVAHLLLTPQSVDWFNDSVCHLADLGFRWIRPEIVTWMDWSSEAFASLDIQIRAVCNQWVESMRNGRFVHIEFLLNTLAAIEGRTDYCKAGVTRCTVDADGTLYPCWGFVGCGDSNWKLGNVQQGVTNTLLQNSIEQFGHERIIGHNVVCPDCEYSPYCRQSCWLTAMKGGLAQFDTDDIVGIEPSSVACQTSRMFYTEALRALHIMKQNGWGRLKSVTLPDLPDIEGVGNQLSPPTTKTPIGESAPLPTPSPSSTIQSEGAESENPKLLTPDTEGGIQNKRSPVKGNLPEIPPPPKTDEVFCKMKPDFLVSVVYASRQEGDEVYKTVESAIKASTGPLEVIVVDDGSTDGSCDNVESLSRPGRTVKWIRLNQPMGAGLARNIGFAAALGRVVVSSDAHMRYPEGLWHEVGGFALEQQALVCPGVAAMYGGPQGWGADLNYHRDGKIGCSYHRSRQVEPERTMGVLGACYFVPREIFDQLSRWPSTVGLWGYEESTLNAWTHLHGIPCWCYPKYMVKHLYRSEAAKGSKEAPWGGPPLADLHLNHAANHLALFQRTTYEKVWRPHYTPYLEPAQRGLLTALETGKMYETGHWCKRRVMTDYEFFRDILRVPTIQDEEGAVTRVRPISVILTTRDEGDEVMRTLRSIINSGQMRFQIVLVDDGSVDGSVPEQQKLVDLLRPKVYNYWRGDLDSRIKVIRHDQPLGVSRSRAEAIEASSGEMIVIMDCHQRVVTRYGLEILCATAQDKDGIVVSSVCNLGNTKSSDPKIRDARTYGARFVVKPKWGILNAHISTRPEQEVVQRDAIIGAGYAMSKEVLERIGGSPTLPGVWSMYEQNVGIRAWIMGVPMYVDATVTMEHRYKKGELPHVPLVSTVMNCALTCYLYFGDELFAFLKEHIKIHGWWPEIDQFLQSESVQEARAMWLGIKEERGHTDEEFFTEKLGLGWPPPKEIE